MLALLSLHKEVEGINRNVKPSTSAKDKQHVSYEKILQLRNAFKFGFIFARFAELMNLPKAQMARQLSLSSPPYLLKIRSAPRCIIFVACYSIFTVGG